MLVEMSAVKRRRSSEFGVSAERLVLSQGAEVAAERWSNRRRIKVRQGCCEGKAAYCTSTCRLAPSQMPLPLWEFARDNQRMVSF
jgi:hypothetical protein